MAELGIAIDGRAPLGEIEAQARAAEEGGASTLWIACHLFLRDPVTTAALANPSQGNVKGFLWFYFINEQLNRYLGKRVPAGYDTVPLLIFWGLTLLWVAPWLAFLPQSLKAVPRRLGELRKHLRPEQQASLLFVIWAVVIVGFFTFSTRQEYYTIPAIPALALLIGGWLAKEAADPDAEWRSARISS